MYLGSIKTTVFFFFFFLSPVVNLSAPIAQPRVLHVVPITGSSAHLVTLEWSVTPGFVPLAVFSGPGSPAGWHLPADWCDNPAPADRPGWQQGPTECPGETLGVMCSIGFSWKTLDMIGLGKHELEKACLRAYCAVFEVLAMHSFQANVFT